MHILITQNYKYVIGQKEPVQNCSFEAKRSPCPLADLEKEGCVGRTMQTPFGLKIYKIGNFWWLQPPLFLGRMWQVTNDCNPPPPLKKSRSGYDAYNVGGPKLGGSFGWKSYCKRYRKMQKLLSGQKMLDCVIALFKGKYIILLRKYSLIHLLCIFQIQKIKM